MPIKSFMLIVLSVFALSLGAENVLADRSSRSGDNLGKALAWCADYRSTHRWKACHVVRKVRKCPKFFRKAKSYKKFRSRGYKTCIRGKKFRRRK